MIQAFSRLVRTHVRTLSVTALSMLLLGMPVMARAQELSPQINEAAAFFAKLADSSDNPVIAAMARESLSKLNTPQKEDMRVEVDLLPQMDNTLAVTAVVNKKYFANFLIDTGAGYTVITPQMAKELGVEIASDTPKMNIVTANGTVSAPIVTLKHVNLGGMDVRGVQAAVIDLGEGMANSGLLGMNFFQGLELTVRPDKLILSKARS